MKADFIGIAMPLLKVTRELRYPSRKRTQVFAIFGSLKNLRGESACGMDLYFDDVGGGLSVPCTIKDIAKQVGVSTATVSRVVNGCENVSSETRTAVQSAISRLRYYPNSHAVELRRANGRGPRKRHIQASKSAHTGTKLITGLANDAQEKSSQAERLVSLEDENSRLRKLVDKISKELERWQGFDRQ